MTNPKITIKGQIWDILDKNHSIVTDKLGDKCVQDIYALISNAEREARIDENRKHSKALERVVATRFGGPKEGGYKRLRRSIRLRQHALKKEQS